MPAEVDFAGLPHCLRLANETVEIIVPTTIGPRILAYRFIGMENVLGWWPHLATTTAWGQWKPWGGHRLWAAPEAMPRTYAPDDMPVAVRSDGEHSARLTQTPDRSGLEKQISITLASAGSNVTLVHTITNHNVWPVRLAPWSITIVRGGGTALLPLEPFRSHDEALLPSQSLVRWYFTDFTDPRWTIGRRFVRLRTDENLPQPQKVGLMNREGWCAYAHGRTVFVKQFEFDLAAEYPDFGCNNEVYTAGSYMELESLGAMAAVEPGRSVRHVETWKLLQDFELTDDEDAGYENLRRLVLAP